MTYRDEDLVLPSLMRIRLALRLDTVPEQEDI